jgi:DNA-binding HxlR family transcriptional regulator
MVEETLSPKTLAPVLGLLANPTRIGILRCLHAGPAGFTELMDHCALDMYSQCGLLNHHIKRLMDSGLIARHDHGYSLTPKGSTHFRFYTEILEASARILSGSEEDGVVNPEGIVVEKFIKDNLESLVDFWMKKYHIDLANRERIEQTLGEAVNRRGRVHFLARDNKQIIGYTAGGTMVLRDLVTGKQSGVVGRIEEIVTADGRDPRPIIRALIDANEEFFRSRSNCKGVVGKTRPEMTDTNFIVYQEKGFHVQNLEAWMRKDF